MKICGIVLLLIIFNGSVSAQPPCNLCPPGEELVDTMGTIDTGNGNFTCGEIQGTMLPMESCMDLQPLAMMECGCEPSMMGEGVCTLCVDGSAPTNPGGSVQLGTGVDTCSGLIAAAPGFNAQTCAAVQAAAAEPCGCPSPEPFFCEVCGDGMRVSMDSAMDIVEIPGQPNRTCAEIEAAGAMGNIPEAGCAPLSSLIQQACTCEDFTEAPTMSPSAPPSFGPFPDCFDDLDQIYSRESEADLSVVRTYILCPGIDYLIGTRGTTPGSTPGFLNPLSPRMNAHYQCGSDGKSSNNCVITGGDFQVLSFFTQFDGDFTPHTNVEFRGLTFSAGSSGSMLFGTAGDISFIDCIIRDHSNNGAIRALYNFPGNNRRLKEFLSQQNIQDPLLYYELMKSAASESSLEQKKEDEEEARALQETNPDIVTTLTLEFIDCIFEENIGLNPVPGVNSGIFTNENSEDVILKIKNSIFRKNTFTATLGWGIRTAGPLEISDSCFIDNDFRINAPVESLYSLATFSLSNNFATPDPLDDAVCNFHAFYETEDDFVNQMASCTEAMATECQSTLYDPPSMPITPTASPVAPTTPPTMPTGAPSSGSFDLDVSLSRVVTVLFPLAMLRLIW